MHAEKDRVSYVIMLYCYCYDRNIIPCRKFGRYGDARGNFNTYMGPTFEHNIYFLFTYYYEKQTLHRNLNVTRSQTSLFYNVLMANFRISRVSFVLFSCSGPFLIRSLLHYLLALSKYIIIITFTSLCASLM